MTPPMMPSQRNALNWEKDCVLKWLIAGSRTNSSTTNMTTEPQAKRAKVSEVARIETTVSDPSDFATLILANLLFHAVVNTTNQRNV